jgi:phytanoyl-CoA dioxygenase PhyH
VPDTDVLAESEQLVAAGRRLDAITLLSDANRARRDPAIEQRLVHLRHDAFDDLSIASGLDVWPPEAPDLFPGTVLPEVEPRDFTSETLRSGLVRHGCLKVRGLVSPARVEQLRNDIDNTMHAFEAWESDASTDPAWFVPFATDRDPALGNVRRWVTGGGGVWTVDSPRAMFDAFETFGEIGIAEPLTGYLGERPALSVKKWTLRRVPVTSGTNWHQDGAFLGHGIRVVNFWLSLSHCGDTAPGLDVLPRRMELLPTGTEGAIFDWSVGEGLVERVAGDEGIMRPIFEAGDALFFDERFLHRTAADPTMTHERYAIESWFFAPSRYPQDQLPLVF